MNHFPMSLGNPVSILPTRTFWTFPSIKSFAESYDTAIQSNAVFRKLVCGIDKKSLQTKVSRLVTDAKLFGRNKIIKENKQITILIVLRKINSYVQHQSRRVYVNLILLTLPNWKLWSQKQKNVSENWSLKPEVMMCFQLSNCEIWIQSWHFVIIVRHSHTQTQNLFVWSQKCGQVIKQAQDKPPPLSQRL